MTDSSERSFPPRQGYGQQPTQGYGAPQGYEQPPQHGYGAARGYGPPQEYDYYRDDRPPRRKRRRVFLWVFLAIQALFIIWVIGGAASGHSAAVHCHDQFLTHAQCASASNAGTAIGVVLVIVFWMVVDVILGVSYGVYRLATRDRYR